MATRPGSQVIAWVVVILAVLVLVPLLAMLGMMAMGGMMDGGMMSEPMAGGMNGIMGTQGWGLLWIVLLAAVLIALIVLVVRGIIRT